MITTSIGIALGTSTSADAEGLLRDAEIAMYRAKRAGKSRFEVFDPAMHSNAVRRLRLETDLRKAVELGEFTAHYQPIVSLQTGKITGFEALTRWQRPEGIVMPGEFISVADETGLIIPMNRLLMRQSAVEERIGKLLGCQFSRLDRLGKSRDGIGGLARHQRLIALGSETDGRGLIGGCSTTDCRRRGKKRGTHIRKHYYTDSHGAVEWNIKVKV